MRWRRSRRCRESAAATARLTTACRAARMPAASVSLLTLSQASCSPRDFHTLVSNIRASFGSTKPAALSTTPPATLTTIDLDRLADEAAAGREIGATLRPANRGDEPDFDRTAAGPADGRPRSVEGQRTRRVAQHQHGGLSRRELGADVESGWGGAHSMGARFARARSADRRLRDRDELFGSNRVGQEFGWQPGHRRFAATRRRSPLEIPSRRVQFDGHVTSTAACGSLYRFAQPVSRPRPAQSRPNLTMMSACPRCSSPP